MPDEEDSTEENVPDYLDKTGRRWHFLCHANAKEDLAQFCQGNGLVPGNENGKRRKFGCSRPECHFRAVFLKANSGIYTRGEHWHEQVDHKRNKSRDISNERIVCSLSAVSKIICRGEEQFYIGKNGKEFKLVRRFETDEDFEKYRQKNWLMKCRIIDKSKYTDRMYLFCRRHSNRRKVSTNCQVSGIYVKHTRSLYQNNQQHNHPMGKEHNDYFSRFLLKYANDKKADYEDPKGQCWHFIRQIDNLEGLYKFTKDQLLYFREHFSIRKNLFCFNCKYAHSGTIKHHPYPPPYCKMSAIFIKATSSVYVRNEHSNHPKFKLKSLSSFRHGKFYRELADFFEAKNAEKNIENVEQNVPMLKEEEADSNVEEGEEVQIVKHLQRDYKCLGRMKREEGREEKQGRTKVHTIQLEEDLEEGTSQGTWGRSRGKFYRYKQRELRQPIIKKEEPEEEAEPAEDAPQPVPQPQMPYNVAWLQQFAVERQPAKMLLRERKKRINYGK